MAEQLHMKILIAATPRKVYEAWVDPRRHAEFTASGATGGSLAGESFTAWDGYIQGVHLELVPGRRIVQTWRTTEFPPDSEDSQLDISLAPEAGKTRLTLIHTNIPDGQAEQYRQGWIDFYFVPLKKYFKEAEPARKKPTKVKSARPANPKAKPRAKPRSRSRARGAKG